MGSSPSHVSSSSIGSDDSGTPGLTVKLLSALPLRRQDKVSFTGDAVESIKRSSSITGISLEVSPQLQPSPPSPGNTERSPRPARFLFPSAPGKNKQGRSPQPQRPFFSTTSDGAFVKPPPPDAEGRLKKTKPKFRSMRDSSATAQLLRAAGGGAAVRRMTTRFYEMAFRDKVLDRFMFAGDGAEAHGRRLGDWIVELMGGEGTPWADSGRLGRRQESHAKAWHSHKREPHERGRRFKLDDCRVWMRLMFWAGRQTGLADHPAFWKWYVGFIQHFIGVYEMTAPPYAVESDRWSTDPANVGRYIGDGFLMTDVVGVEDSAQARAGLQRKNGHQRLTPP